MKKKLDILLKKLKDTISDLQAIYIEKGIKPFQKPLIYSLCAILISYLIYISNTSTLKTKKNEIDNLMMLNGFYNEYTSIKQQIDNYSLMLPKIKDKDEWLNYILNTNASKYKIVFSNTESQEEVRVDTQNILIVSKRVQFTTDYNTLGLFIKDIENSSVFIEVSKLGITKSVNGIGNLDVSLTISTIFEEKI
jgi:Tfp pilus assembly protein PilO